MIICSMLKAIQILIFIVIFLLLTQNISIQMKFLKVLNVFEKNGFSVLHVENTTGNKNFETCKKLYSKLNCTFSMIYFSKTWATNNSIYNDSNFQRVSYTA